jgi:hypothetical protein
VIGDTNIDGTLTLIDQTIGGSKTITAANNNLTFLSVHGIFGYSIGLRGNRGSTLGMESAGSILDISAPSDITLTPGGDTEIQSDLIVEGTTTVGKITLSDNSFVTETSSFTLGETHRGATVLLQNTAPITITVPSQVAGHTTTFIAETVNTVTFASGTGLSAFNSFNSANQIAGIFGQAQIIFKTADAAFLGGNVV